jgi:hypothetical protein
MIWGFWKERRNRTATNPQGLTFEEWACAAGVALFDRYGFRPEARLYARRHRAAWRNGEDPTEYRR